MHYSTFSIKDFVIQNYAVFLKIAGIVLLAVAISYVISQIYKKMHPKFLGSKRFWDDALLIAIYRPLQLTVWFVSIIGIILLAVTDKAEIQWIDKFRTITLIVILFWFFIRFIRQLEKNLFQISLSPKGKVDKTSLRALSQLFRLIAIIIAVLILLQVIGIPISGVIAFGGFGGIALGFAAKDTLSNFFGGLMIFLDRPFAIGDWIRSPDREIEGYVEQIGWRLTRIRTFDKRPLYIPNGLFSTISVENPSRMQNRRIKETVGIRYNDAFKVKDLLADIENMLKNHPEIDHRRICFVNLIHFGQHALEVRIYTFTKTTKWVEFQNIRQDVFLKIIDIIKKHKAECAFPTTTIHVPEQIKLSKE